MSVIMIQIRFQSNLIADVNFDMKACMCMAIVYASV